MWGVAWDWYNPPTFIVTIQLNCHSSVLYLAVTDLYYPQFSQRVYYLDPSFRPQSQR